MKTLIIDVCSLEETQRRTIAAIQGDEKYRGNFLSFVSWELLHKVLTPKCVNILEVMTGAGELSIREVAKRVGRDVKGVHTDIHKMIENGIIERGENGVIFPYDEMRFDFTIGHAAA